MTTLIDVPTEIDFWGVYDRGVPNSERIAFRPRFPIELGRYVLVVAIRQPDGITCRSLFDNAFFFPDVIVEPPAWVFVYTGAGKPRITVEPNTQDPVHALYWHRQTTIFNAPDITAYVARLDGLAIAPDPAKTIDSSMLRFPYSRSNAGG